MKRPACCTDAMLTYLDDRATLFAPMSGAASALESIFRLSAHEARQVFKFWCVFNTVAP